VQPAPPPPSARLDTAPSDAAVLRVNVLVDI